MRDALAGEEERRLLHDFVNWRREVRSVEDLGAYRTQQRNLSLGNARPEPVTVAETTASAFRVARVPPLVGRPLLDGDEQPGAPPVVVLGYTLWQRHFDGRDDVVGKTVRLGRVVTTVVGVMPEGFAFPVNHRLWVPLQLRASGYAPLEGAGIRVFGRLSGDASQAQANAELAALVARAAATSPETYRHLRPRVLAYGGESPGDRSLLEDRRETPARPPGPRGRLHERRDADLRAHGDARGRAGPAARARGGPRANRRAALRRGARARVGRGDRRPGLRRPGAEVGDDAPTTRGRAGRRPSRSIRVKPATVLYAAALAVIGAAIFGMLPALKVARAQVDAPLRNAAAGRSTLRFGWAWTTAMIAQVALTVICLPPAMGISEEALRDRRIRERTRPRRTWPCRSAWTARRRRLPGRSRTKCSPGAWSGPTANSNDRSRGNRVSRR